MAVTHDDLSATAHQGKPSAGRSGVVLMIISILCGLGCFILCLVAEATRSEVIWIGVDVKKDEDSECVYSGSGKTPLACALVAFLALAAAMVAKHSYILAALTEPDPSNNLTDPWMPDFSHSHTLQACFFFAASWVCFAVGEVLLMIGVGVESGHLKQWAMPRSSCLVAGTGLFATAGSFGLATVLFAGGLYLTLLHAQRVRREHAGLRREVMDISFLYAAASPPHRLSRNMFDLHAPALTLRHHTAQAQPQYNTDHASAVMNVMNEKHQDDTVVVVSLA